MNYIYERMLEESEEAILTYEQYSKFSDYVNKNYEEFYANKITYEVIRNKDNTFTVIMFNNPVFSLEDILVDIS
jgi:hypothetical protein